MTKVEMMKIGDEVFPVAEKFVETAEEYGIWTFGDADKSLWDQEAHCGVHFTHNGAEYNVEITRRPKPTTNS
jgi:hypothetical protein